MNKPAQTRFSVATEIFSAAMMALVAVATAWSGYQSARWSGVQSTNYAAASAKRIEASVAAIRAGQEGLLDVLLFNDWLTATLAGNAKQAALDQKRFRPAFAGAFGSWIATDPLANPAAPPSPLLMPGYQEPDMAISTKIDGQASILFAAGLAANQQSDDYVLTTVVLAAVLFFIALSQRFENLRIRLCLDSMALVMLVAALYRLWLFPVM